MRNGKGLRFCRRENLIAARYEFLQSPHLFIYSISASLQEHDFSFVIDSACAKKKYFNIPIFQNKYIPFLRGCELLQPETSLLMLIHELISWLLQIQNQHPDNNKTKIVSKLYESTYSNANNSNKLIKTYETTSTYKLPQFQPLFDNPKL